MAFNLQLVLGLYSLYPSPSLQIAHRLSGIKMIKRLLGLYVLETLNLSKRIVLFSFLTWCLKTQIRAF